MKHLAFTLVFSLYGALSFAQGPYIVSLDILPQNPSTSDEIFVATHVITGNLGQYLGSSIDINGNNVTIESCYYEGIFTQPQDYYDTISLGYLGGGNYNLNFTGYISLNNLDCEYQSSNSQDTIFFVESFAYLDKTHKSETTIYPNPSKGAISIQTDAHISNVEINDLSGRLFESIDFSNSQIHIENKGTYLIRLLDHGNILETHKIVIE